jgi:hypothetical protein
MYTVENSALQGLEARRAEVMHGERQLIRKKEEYER